MLKKFLKFAFKNELPLRVRDEDIDESVRILANMNVKVSSDKSDESEDLVESSEDLSDSTLEWYRTCRIEYVFIPGTRKELFIDMDTIDYEKLINPFEESSIPLAFCDEFDSDHSNLIVDLLDNIVPCKHDKRDITCYDDYVIIDIPYTGERYVSRRVQYTAEANNFTFICLDDGYIYERGDYKVFALNAVCHPHIECNTFTFCNSDGSTDFEQIYDVSLQIHLKNFKYTLLDWLVFPTH